MLVHYKHHNITYKILIKHLNEPTKSYVFIITKDEDIPKKALEEILTLYVIKTELLELSNLILILYKNKYYISHDIDIKKFRQIHFNYKHRISICGESEIDENIKILYKSKIDIYYSMNAYFDNYDYVLLTRNKKRELRLKQLKIYRRKERFKNLFTFTLFKKLRSA